MDRISKRGLLVGAGAALMANTFARVAAAAQSDACPSTVKFGGNAQVRTHRMYADGRFGQVHFTVSEPVTATTKTPLVCMHTSPASAVEFKIFQKVMARDRVVLCPDTPGFGSSDAPSKAPTIPDYSGAIADALRKMGYGAQKKVDVLGTHTGAMVGADMAVTQADLVRKVIISSIVHFEDEKARADMKARTTGPTPILTDAELVPNTFRSSVINGQKDVAPERRLEMFAERIRAGYNAYWGPDAVFAYDLAPTLKKIQQPTLMLVVRDTLSANTRLAAKLPPHVTVIDIEARTRMNSWDLEPDLVACEVASFLDKA